MGGCRRSPHRGPRIAFVMAFGVACVLLQVFMQYTRYVSVSKWMTLGTVLVRGDAICRSRRLGLGRKQPRSVFSSDSQYWAMVVAILGTTISPYLFFWQASQEAEDLHEIPRRQTLTSKPRQAKARTSASASTRWSGWRSQTLSPCASSSRSARRCTKPHPNIESSAQAAEALKPIAGELAFALFTLGIVGTGLLSGPVLAGSAAFALGEALH